MKKRHILVLKEITENIPQELLDALVVKKPVFGTLKQVAEKALKSPKISKEDKKKFKTVLDSGYLDKMVDVVDTSVEKQIDQYIDIRIKAAVDEGLLPASIKIPTLKRKGKKHVRHNAKKRSDSKED